MHVDDVRSMDDGKIETGCIVLHQFSIDTRFITHQHNVKSAAALTKTFDGTLDLIPWGKITPHGIQCNANFLNGLAQIDRRGCERLCTKKPLQSTSAVAIDDPNILTLASSL
jgi:hypothetical protein